ncbi:MAG: hypothetical protein SGPRY_011050, partial [Prymnesium sp.]
MIEGGTQVIGRSRSANPDALGQSVAHSPTHPPDRSCAVEQLAHRVVLTLAPKFTHGTRPAFDGL